MNYFLKQTGSETPKNNPDNRFRESIHLFTGLKTGIYCSDNSFIPITILGNKRVQMITGKVISGVWNCRISIGQIADWNFPFQSFIRFQASSPAIIVQGINTSECCTPIELFFPVTRPASWSELPRRRQRGIVIFFFHSVQASWNSLEKINSGMPTGPIQPLQGRVSFHLNKYQEFHLHLIPCVPFYSNSPHEVQKSRRFSWFSNRQKKMVHTLLKKQKY